MVALLVLNKEDFSVELDAALVARIAIATGVQPDVGHVGVAVNCTLRTMRALVEELLIRMLLLVMGLQHGSRNEDQGAQAAGIFDVFRFGFDSLAAGGARAFALCLLDTVEYGMMVATCRLPEEDPWAVGALEAIGSSEGGFSSGMVALFVPVKIGRFVESGKALRARMRQLAEMVQDVQLEGITVGENLLAVWTTHRGR